MVPEKSTFHLRAAAHHCTLKHPAHRIMSGFYMPLVRAGSKELPRVLGLTASPVMKAVANKQSLEYAYPSPHSNGADIDKGN